MKEAIAETRPLVLDSLLKIPASFIVCTEWNPLPASKARKEVNKRRRHFNMSKTAFVSQMGNDVTKTNPRDVLVDESKQADIENLGDCLRALGDGQSLGDFSLSIVLYGDSKDRVDQLVGEFVSVFTNADGNLFATASAPPLSSSNTIRRPELAATIRPRQRANSLPPNSSMIQLARWRDMSPLNSILMRSSSI